MSDIPVRHGLGYSAIAGRWGWFVAFGVLSIVAGFFALGDVVAFTLISTIFIGAALLVTGIFQLVHAFMTKTWSQFGFNVVFGLLYIAGGLLIMQEPVEGSVTITLFLLLALVIGGVLRITVPNWMTSAETARSTQPTAVGPPVEEVPGCVVPVAAGPPVVDREPVLEVMGAGAVDLPGEVIDPVGGVADPLHAPTPTRRRTPKPAKVLARPRAGRVSVMVIDATRRTGSAPTTPSSHGESCPRPDRRRRDNVSKAPESGANGHSM